MDLEIVKAAQSSPLLHAISSRLQREDGVDVVILVDGLGADLLEESAGYTRFLRALKSDLRVVSTIAPSTTAAVLASMFTGCTPAQHGITGYSVLDPVADCSHTQLGVQNELDAKTWLRVAPLSIPAGKRAIQVGPEKFRSSFLTSAIQPNWLLEGYSQQDRRFAAVKRAIGQLNGNGVLYIHISEVDHAGHAYAPKSTQWFDALETIDRELERLMTLLPAGARVLITADHGMVRVDEKQRVDLTNYPELAKQIRAIGGEPRALTLRLTEGSDTATAQEQFTQILGAGFEVLTTHSALRQGIFGLGDDPEIVARLGDLVVWAKENYTLVHSKLHTPGMLRLKGVHGSLSSNEMLIPWLEFER